MKIRPQKNAVMNLPLFVHHFLLELFFLCCLLGLISICFFSLIPFLFLSCVLCFHLLFDVFCSTRIFFFSSSSSSSLCFLPLLLLLVSSSSVVAVLWICILVSSFCFHTDRLFPLAFPLFPPLVCFVFSETKREFHALPVIRFSS